MGLILFNVYSYASGETQAEKVKQRGIYSLTLPLPQGKISLIFYPILILIQQFKKNLRFLINKKHLHQKIVLFSYKLKFTEIFLNKHVCQRYYSLLWKLKLAPNPIMQKTSISSGQWPIAFMQSWKLGLKEASISL